MNPIAKLYLKTFLLTGLPFGLLTQGFDLVGGGEFSLWKFLFMTFFFGLTMSLILVSFHRYRLKKSGIQELTNQNVGVNQTRIVKSTLTKAELIQKLENDPVFGNINRKETETGIFFNTAMTWKSWGEKIEIRLKPHQEIGFEYHISSKPKLKTTLVDYGKNLENVDWIENMIKDTV